MFFVAFDVSLTNCLLPCVYELQSFYYDTLCNHLDNYDSPHYMQIFDVKSIQVAENERGHCSVQRLQNR